MQDIWVLYEDACGRYNSAKEKDDTTFYTELVGQITPSFRQVFEDAQRVASDDAEIMELQELFQNLVEEGLSDFEMKASALSNQDYIQWIKAEFHIRATNAMEYRYWRTLRSLAEERSVPLELPSEL